MPKRTGRHWREKVVPRVIRRDGGICHLCDQPGADTADHIVPAGHGGPWYDMANLKAAHNRPCNQIRGDRSISWARAEIRRRWTELFDTSPPGSDTSWDW